MRRQGRKKKSKEGTGIMKRRTICSGIILATCILMAAGIFIKYIEIDFGRTAGILNAYLGEIFGRIPEIEDGKVSFSVYTLIRGVLLLKDEGSVGNPKVNDFLFHIFIVLLLPYFIGIVNGILAFLRKKWSYIVSAVFSVLTAAFLLMDPLFFIPGKLMGLLPAYYNIAFGGNGESLFRNLILSGFSVGYWINLLSLLIAFIAAFVGCFGKNKVKRKKKKIGKEPEILCFCGMLEGARIPVRDGDEILVGRDAQVSHLILEGEGVSRRHCRIRYDGSQEAYFVTDYSMNGTFLSEGDRLPTNQEIRLSRGSVIFLGNRESRLSLE